MRIEIAAFPLEGLTLACGAVGDYQAGVHQLVAIVPRAAVHAVAERRVKPLEPHTAERAVNLVEHLVPADQRGLFVRGKPPSTPGNCRQTGIAAGRSRRTG